MIGMRTAYAPLLVCAVLIGTLGVVHGIYTDRWGPSGQLTQALENLPRVPKKCGDWNGEDVSYDEESLAHAGIRGGVFRRYTNPKTGESISMMIVCGRGGPITVHTPDICYATAGFRQLTAEQKKEVDTGASQRDSFYVARFGNPTAVAPTQMEIYWTWSRDGRTWRAPDNPRFSFARAPALYKMYVVREFAPKSRAEALETNEEFIRQALPVIRGEFSPIGS